MLITPEMLSILNKHHVRLTPGEIATLLDLLRANNKIAAIILIREVRGLGLKEAKDIADALGQIVRDE